MKRNQWRTALVAALGIVASYLGLRLVAWFPAASAAYPAFCGAIGFCVGAVAAKAGYQSRVEAPK